MKRSRRKALGQHFLKSRSVLRKIIRAIDPKPEDLIIEIGPGKGVLTFPLARQAGKVIAIEKDRSLTPALRGKKIPRLLILEEDVLRVDFQKLLEGEKQPRAHTKIVGNLPYSISSPLLFKLFAEKELFSECVFLLQKEVAQRIGAEPGSKRFAPLSILFQIYFSVNIYTIIPPEAFSPPPRVESALISLKRRTTPLFPIEDEAPFLSFLKGAFQHRRKTLLNNLERMDFSPSEIESAFQKCRIKKEARAEELSISQFFRLFTLLCSDFLQE